MSDLLSLPTEIRLKIWSFCISDNVEIAVCHCFSDDEVRSKCWEARQCLTIEINEDIQIPTPPLLLVSHQVQEESKPLMRPYLTLVLCRYVCAVMFLYNSTIRQRALVDRIRLTHEVDRPLWRPASNANKVTYLQGLLTDHLWKVAFRFYHIVKQVSPTSEYDKKTFVAAEVEVGSVDVSEPSSD